MNKLTEHLRQYRHNDNFVACYDRVGVETFVGSLEEEIKALKAQVNQFKDGVTHFNKSHGDLNRLLVAYVHTPAYCLADVRAEAVIDYEASLSSFPMAAEEYAQQLRDNAK